MASLGRRVDGWWDEDRATILFVFSLKLMKLSQSVANLACFDVVYRIAEL